MKAMDLRHKTPDELGGMLADLKKEQFNLRFQQASGQLENTARVKVVRRDIARIRTILLEVKAGKVVAPKVEKPAKKAAKPAAKKTAKPAAKKEAKKAAPKKAAKAAAKTEKKPAKKPAKTAAKSAKK